MPRRLQTGEGVLALSAGQSISLNGADVQNLRFAAEQLRTTVHEDCGFDYDITAGSALIADNAAFVLSLVPGGVRQAQGYELTITPERVFAIAGDHAGLFYAVQTLRQIVAQCGATLPALRISDWPDFPNRGVMLDISRNKVPTMGTLCDLIERLAAWKINQVQLYMEHTFAYRRHPVVWAEASPITAEEVLALDAFCRQRCIELVPNQNSFGHLTNWLIHDAYRDLAEAPDGCDTRWGHYDTPFGLNPSDPRSLALVCEMYDELLPNFSSRQFNVGLDETIDLGLGRSKERVEREGVGRVYLDFLLKIYREVRNRGCTMQFWGDIIMEHPELTGELPRDAIALEWGYQAEHPFAEHGAQFAASGIPFYVCPGTSSWNTIAGRTENTVGNLRNAAENGLKHGAIGYLITDWGDNGHWQPLPVSYLGFVYGAALAWNYSGNLDLDIADALNRYAFADEAGIMGRLAYELGNVYLIPGVKIHNTSPLFAILQGDKESIERIRNHPILGFELPPDLDARLQHSAATVAALKAHLPQAQMKRADAALIQREFAWAADMLQHACKRGRWLLSDGGISNRELRKEADQLISEYRALWHERNRPGGFGESVARMEKMRDDYSLFSAQTNRSKPSATTA
jgi:hypothetical protein